MADPPKQVYAIFGARPKPKVDAVSMAAAPAEDTRELLQTEPQSSARPSVISAKAGPSRAGNEDVLGPTGTLVLDTRRVQVVGSSINTDVKAKKQVVLDKEKRKQKVVKLDQGKPLKPKVKTAQRLAEKNITSKSKSKLELASTDDEEIIVIPPKRSKDLIVSLADYSPLSRVSG